MATNPFFNHFPAANFTNEQILIEELLVESIQQFGMDVYYLPRTVKSGNSIDYIYGEDTLKEYLSAHLIEMYLENVIGMDGEGDFISKFGLEIRDELSFLVSRRRFISTIPNLIRPLEGDLIYVPLVQNFFEITSVEHENDQAMFYTLGKGRGGNVYVYALKLKQFVFSSEIISTGVEEVDTQIADHYPRTRINIISGTGNFIANEIVYQGTDLSSATAKALIYSTGDNHLDVIRVQGSFTSANVKGYSSNANWSTNTVSEMEMTSSAFEDLINNNDIQQESDAILDFSSINPFGTP